MFRLGLIVTEVLPSAFVLIPVMLVLHRIYFRNCFKTMLFFLFALYLACVYGLVGLPNAAYIRFDINLNLKILTGIIGDLKNSLLNILLFIPMGFFISFLFQEYRSPLKSAILGFGISFGIELLQIFTYRATDINDLITNTAGTFVGSVTANVLYMYMPDKWLINGVKKELFLVIMVVFNVMFFIQPLLYAILHHG